MKDKFLLSLLVLTLLLAIGIWLSVVQKQTGPEIKVGVLDLQGWDPAAQAVFDLDGEWEFYPQQLISPEQMPEKLKGRQYIKVPGNWNGVRAGDDQIMKGYGFGTYRLLIRHAPKDQLLGLYKEYVRFSDRLYINGKLMGESGSPGVSRSSYEPRNVPYTAFFHAEDEVELLLQVANFDYKAGGIHSSLQFGLGHAIAIEKKLQNGLELMGAMILLFFALLYTWLYVGFQRNRLFLLFGAFFFCFALSVLTNGDRLFLQLFPNVSFELAFKIKCIAVYSTPALHFYITWLIMGKRGVHKLFLFAAIVLAIYCALIFILPFHMYSSLQGAFYLFQNLIYAIIIGVLLVSYVKGRYGMLNKRQFQFYLYAAWFLLYTGVITILNNWNAISMVLSQLTVLMFVLSICMMMLHHYVGTYTSMKALTRQLQVADRMKDEFLLLTSHELNTPLHGIIHLSQSMLKVPVSKAAESSIKERLQLIRNTAFRMSNMVGNIIDAARIKEGQLETSIKRVDLLTCISLVIEGFGFLAKGKNTLLIQRIKPDARYVLADENRLMQVLYSALSYSLRHVQNGEVMIASCNQDELTLISITLTGQSAEGSGHEAEGDIYKEGAFATSLSIVYELVALMAGKLDIDDDKGQITIVLPSAAADVVPAVDGVTHVNDSREQKYPDTVRDVQESPKILIASADPVNVEYLFGMLTNEGFRVEYTGTGKDTYKMVTRLDRPDLILLDVMLPSENGYELCRQIREIFTQVELPILFIMARSTPADIEAAIAAGGSDFIARPLDAGEIRVRIHTLLSMKRLVKEAAVNEMAFLRSQIKPHFLYNALGTIMSLCYTDGVRAGELLGIFSRYLRIIFHMDNTEETVPLRKEMELIQAYINIEKERFGSRIKFEYDVDEQLYGCQIIPLTIEPLVENAIRHGVSRKVSGGTVKLIIRKENEYMQVIVEDDGAGMLPEQVQSILNREGHGQGVGFQNIMRRVSYLSGKQPAVESEPGIGTKVTIWLPLSY
ncbi:histidine kinase [Paenibacillus sp. GCM10012307]|uniref:histidine kinase n=1 Tax=Paenibacillus sp. GCM10012307 TaxID=3317343 RepID=UPI003619A126